MIHHEIMRIYRTQTQIPSLRYTRGRPPLYGIKKPAESRNRNPNYAKRRHAFYQRHGVRCGHLCGGSRIGVERKISANHVRMRHSLPKPSGQMDGDATCALHRHIGSGRHPNGSANGIHKGLHEPTQRLHGGSCANPDCSVERQTERNRKNRSLCTEMRKKRDHY